MNYDQAVENLLRLPLSSDYYTWSERSREDFLFLLEREVRVLASVIQELK